MVLHEYAKLSLDQNSCRNFFPLLKWDFLIFHLFELKLRQKWLVFAYDFKYVKSKKWKIPAGIFAQQNSCRIFFLQENWKIPAGTRFSCRNFENSCRNFIFDQIFQHHDFTFSWQIWYGCSCFHPKFPFLTKSFE